MLGRIVAYLIVLAAVLCGYLFSEAVLGITLLLLISVVFGFLSTEVLWVLQLVAFLAMTYYVTRYFVWVGKIFFGLPVKD